MIKCDENKTKADILFLVFFQKIIKNTSDNLFTKYSRYYFRLFSLYCVRFASCSVLKTEPRHSGTVRRKYRMELLINIEEGAEVLAVNLGLQNFTNIPILARKKIISVCIARQLIDDDDAHATHAGIRTPNDQL